MRVIGATVLLFLLVLNGCRDHPQFIFGDTYFHQQKIQRSFTNALDAQAVDAVRGVYWKHLYAVKEYPALLFIDARKHFSFALLKDAPALVPGDFIEASGVVVDTLLRVGRSTYKPVRIFKVARASVINPTHGFLAAAQRDWQELIARLKERGRRGSRLVWPQKPKWRLLVDEPAGTAIAFFGIADLMYVLDVNLVYDSHSGKLLKVYVNEWFKGE